jgi:hypothetical protein
MAGRTASINACCAREPQDEDPPLGGSDGDLLLWHPIDQDALIRECHLKFGANRTFGLPRSTTNKMVEQVNSPLDTLNSPVDTLNSPVDTLNSPMDTLN